MRYAIIDKRVPAPAVRGLMLLGFSPIFTARATGLSEAVSSHPDSVIFRHENTMITSADYCDDAPYLFSDIRERSEINITFTADTFGDRYPQDAIFNALVIGKKIFLKSDTASPAILDYARRAGLEIIHTNQGYPACTTLAFGNNAITADSGMAKILSDAGISVTKISEGGISLPPHKYGFIGGAAGVFENKVMFFGDINTHPDARIIKAAITAAGYEPHSLSYEPLADFGGIIFI